MANGKPNDKQTAGQRFKDEMRSYIVIFIYLWVFFGAVLLVKVTALQSQDIDYLPFGLAAIKALIFGKFILIGEAVAVGSRKRTRSLFATILWRSLAFLLLLIMFNTLEELVVGMYHGESIAAIAAEIAARPALQTIAPLVLMFVGLIPLIAFKEIDKALGAGTLPRLLFEPTNRD